MMSSMRDNKKVYQNISIRMSLLRDNKFTISVIILKEGFSVGFRVLNFRLLHIFVLIRSQSGFNVFAEP